MVVKKKQSKLDRLLIEAHKAGDHKYRKDMDCSLCRKGKR